MISNPFGPDGPFHEFFRRERERAEMFRRLLGPAYELQQRMTRYQDPFPILTKLRDATSPFGALLNGSNFHTDSLRSLQALASPAWMQAVQSPALRIGQDEFGILKTQKLLAGGMNSDVLKLVKTVEQNRSIVEKLMVANRWTESFRSLSERLAPSLIGLKAAADRAKMLDMMTLRASADEVAASRVIFATEQVLEVHRLVEAIGHAESASQGSSLLAALLTAVAALFARFGDNTADELRKMGAFGLIGLLSAVLALIQPMMASDMSASEKKVVAEMHAEVQTLKDKFDQIQTADLAANEMYVSNLPRAELKRASPIRHAGDGRAAVLLRGSVGMLLAVKDTKGRWREVVYRDPLTDQLAEGWVYAPAVQLLDEPAR